jgi:hypothetical protein
LSNNILREEGDREDLSREIKCLGELLEEEKKID